MSAPCSFAIEAIVGSSVETTTLLNRLHCMAVSIVHAMRGFLPNLLIFLFGSSLDPLLAGIKASILIEKNQLFKK